MHPFRWNADRVDQAAGTFDDAGQGIAGAQFARDRLGDECAQAIEIHDPVEALREGAGRGHDRIAQCQAANSHRQIDSGRGAHGSASIRSNTGPSQQTRRCTISPSTLKSRTQQKQRPEAACHLLLHRDLTGQIEFARQSLLHPHQPAGAAGEERFAAAFRDQAAENAFDIRRSAGRFRIRYRDHFGAVPAEKIDGDDQLGTPRAEDRGNADAGVARGLRKRRERRKAGAAPDGDDVAPDSDRA